VETCPGGPAAGDPPRGISIHPKVIQERLGHASIETTLDTYGHLFDGLDEAAAERLDAFWHSSRVDALWTRSGRGVVQLPGG
jgi:hypothetical protein